MTNEAFYEVFGRIINTEGTEVTQKLIDAKNKGEKIKEIASEKGFGRLEDLNDNDINDLVKCIEEFHNIKSHCLTRSPRS